MIDRAECPFCARRGAEALVRVPFEAPALGAFLSSYCGGRAAHDVRRYVAAVHPRRRRHAPPVRRLDGAGFGFQVHGVEISPARLDWARRQGIACSAPESLPDGPFDFIRLEQVLEHVPEPRAMMADLVSRLRPGGYVLVGVPDGRPVPGRARTPESLFRKGPAQPLEHINIFTPASLAAFMRAFGCLPMVERESFIRVSGLRQSARDAVAAIARAAAPALVTLRTTRGLFRKAS